VILAPADIASLAAAAGFQGNDLTTAIAVALAESGGNTGPPDGDQGLAPGNGPSKGLWQINVGQHAHPEMGSWNLYDPPTNAAAAFQIYTAGGGSFRAWTQFLNGKYVSYLPAAAAGAAAISQATVITAGADGSAPQFLAPDSSGDDNSLLWGLGILALVILFLD
jgi:hypothetical protein